MFLPGESQGWGSLVGCRLWGRTESDTTEVAQEDGVEDQHVHPQLPVQLPLVQMDAEDLEGDRASVGFGEQRNNKRHFYWKITHEW